MDFGWCCDFVAGEVKHQFIFIFVSLFWLRTLFYFYNKSFLFQLSFMIQMKLEISQFDLLLTTYTYVIIS